MFLHEYSPDPIAFSIGPFSAHWYGIILVVGILIGYYLSGVLAKKAQVEKNQVLDIYANVVICGIIGARLYHIILSPKFYLQNPLQIFAIWNGGLAIHGAIFAAILVVFYYVKRYKINFYKYADIFVIPAILGQAMGRWGNYFNQELPGAPTELPWGIPIDSSSRPFGYENFTYFHPAFLYESAWNFFSFIILFIVFRQKNKPDGIVFWLYIALYSLGRCMMEFVRIEDTPLLLGIRVPLLVSAGLFILATSVIIKKMMKSRNKI